MALEMRGRAPGEENRIPVVPQNNDGGNEMQNDIQNAQNVRNNKRFVGLDELELPELGLRELLRNYFGLEPVPEYKCEVRSHSHRHHPL